MVEETSWPYAPTFWIGVAPAEPGIPARHSIPASPASTVRATASLQTSLTASSSVVPESVQPRVAIRRAVPANPLSPMTRLDPPPMTSSGVPLASASRAASITSASVSAVISRVAGPPRRKVVRGRVGLRRVPARGQAYENGPAVRAGPFHAFPDGPPGGGQAETSARSSSAASSAGPGTPRPGISRAAASAATATTAAPIHRAGTVPSVKAVGVSYPP